MMNNRQGEQNEGVEQAPQPQFCANNCGFFANPACVGLCSKCYQEKIKRDQSSRMDQQPGEPRSIIERKSPSIGKEQENFSSTSCKSLCENVSRQDAQAAQPQPAASNIVVDTDATPSKPSKPTNRCACCNKKVGLMGFKCRCGQTFCSTHRLAEAHACDFDFKQYERQKIADSNPVVAGSKLERI